MIAKQQQESEAYLRVVMAVADVVKELGSVPSGHLYARLMDRMSLADYQAVVDLLKHAKLVEERNHLLTWKGPR